MADLHLPHYIAWAQTLGDRLQRCDLARALQFNALASALIRYRDNNNLENTDDRFMNFCMF
jgi:hypothetical protein